MELPGCWLAAHPGSSVCVPPSPKRSGVHVRYQPSPGFAVWLCYRAWGCGEGEAGGGNGAPVPLSAQGRASKAQSDPVQPSYWSLPEGMVDGRGRCCADGAETLWGAGGRGVEGLQRVPPVPPPAPRAPHPSSLYPPFASRLHIPAPGPPLVPPQHSSATGPPLPGCNRGGGGRDTRGTSPARDWGVVPPKPRGTPQLRSPLWGRVCRRHPCRSHGDPGCSCSDNRGYLGTKPPPPPQRPRGSGGARSPGWDCPGGPTVPGNTRGDRRHRVPARGSPGASQQIRGGGGGVLGQRRGGWGGVPPHHRDPPGGPHHVPRGPGTGHVPAGSGDQLRVSRWRRGGGKHRLGGVPAVPEANPGSPGAGAR